MTLIIVQRSKTETYRRLAEKFAMDRNVKVVFERRVTPARENEPESATARRERRRLNKAFGGRDYVVVHLADDPK